MESDYRTSGPVLCTACAVLTFAFTSTVFLVYDRLILVRRLVHIRSQPKNDDLRMCCL
jgi:hypothetical protein